MARVRSVAAAAVLYSFVAAAPTPVTIREYAFEPATVAVEVHDTVTWTNRGELVHTVKVDNEESSGPIQPGHAESNQFDTPGTRAYHCELHPTQMTGTIVVKAAGPTSSTTSTTLRRPASTTTTAAPSDSSTTAPSDSTSSTTTTSVADSTTTTSPPEAATRVTDTGDDNGDNVDVPGAVAAILLLVTAAGAFVQTRGGFR